MVVRALPAHRLGGLENHARDLIVALARRGHKLDILTTLGGKKQRFPSDTRGSIMVHELKGSRAGDYSPAFYRLLDGRLREIVSRGGIDVVLAIDLTGLFLKPETYSVPIVPLIHGTLTSEVSLDRRYAEHLGWRERLRDMWRYKSRLILRPWFKKMVTQAGAMIVDSEFTRRELMFEILGSDHGGGEAHNLARRIHVVPLGIDPDRYPVAEATVEREDDSILRICLLGRLQRQKGIEIAIRAAGALKARGVGFVMDIGGTGDYREQAEGLIAELGLGDQVRLVGRVEPEQLGRFFISHNVFLFPDLTQPAFGLVALEAMKYGLPVVAARVGAVPEVVTEDCGWLYDAWDMGKLAALLESIAGSGWRVRSKGDAARDRAAEFSVEAMAAGVEKVLLGCVGDR